MSGDIASEKNGGERMNETVIVMKLVRNSICSSLFQGITKFVITF